MITRAARQALGLRTLVLAIGVTVATPVLAQRVPAAAEQDAEPASPPPAPSWLQDERPGSVADSAVGEAGRRQTREQEIGGIKPMMRLNSRIANRVQSRLRTRIDRNYDPRANAVSPFEVADEEVRTAGGPRNR